MPEAANPFVPSPSGVQYPPLAPQDPSSLVRRSEDVLGPSESSRLAKILAALRDPRKCIVAIPYREDSLPLIKGQIALIDKTLQAQGSGGLGIEVPETLPKVLRDPRERYGIDANSLEQLEATTIGHVPSDFIRLAYHYHYQTDRKAVPVDLFPVKTLEERFTQRVKDVLEEHEEVRVSPQQQPAEGQTLVEPEDLERDFQEQYARSVASYFIANKIAMAGMPGIDPALDRAIQHPNEVTDDFNAPEVAERFRQQGWKMIPVAFDGIWPLYRTYMNPRLQPLLDYVMQIGRRLSQEATSTDAVELELSRAARSTQTAGPQGQAGPNIPLRYNWKVPGEAEAKALFPAGKKKGGAVILHIDDNAAAEFFDNTETGLMTDRATALMTRIMKQNDALVGTDKNFKIVLLCRIPPRVKGQGEATIPHSGISEVDIPTPLPSEIRDNILPYWMFQLEKQGYKFKWGGKDVFILQPGKKGLSQDALRFATMAARYSNGLSATGLQELLEAVRLDAVGSAAAETSRLSLRPQEFPALDLELFLARMRDKYLAFLFKSVSPTEGTQLSQIFSMVTQPAEKMSLHKKVTQLISNYKVAYRLGNEVETRGSRLTLKALQDLVAILGTNIFRDLGIPTVRTPDMPPGQMVWSEITDKDMPKVREMLAAVIRRKKNNFILLHGPGGTGKTSIAKVISEALDLPLIEVKAQLTQGSLVGHTEKTVEAMFQAIFRMRDCVILFDEVDQYFVGTASTSGRTLSPGTEAVKNAFKTNLDRLSDGGIAARNNLIVVSTTNNHAQLAAIDKNAITRRLSGNGAADIKIDAPTDPAEIKGIVDVLLARTAGTDPLFPMISKAVLEGGPDAPPLATALLKEAQPPRSLPYTGSEIGALLKMWIGWNMDTVYPEYCSPETMAYRDQATGRDIPVLFQARTLDYLVANANRQSKNKGGEDGSASLEMITIPEYVILGKVKQPAPSSGRPLPGSTRQPIPTQVPTRREPQLVAEPEAPETQAVPAPPLSENVDPEAELERAETSSFAPARRSPPARTAQAQEKPMIRLMAVADNDLDRAHGLKFVKHLPDGEGMLFKFQSPRVLSFWSVDTYIPLDIAFIDKDGFVVKSERMVPLSTRPVGSGHPCVMALEVAAGTLEKFGGKIGAKATIDLEKKTVMFASC